MNVPAGCSGVPQADFRVLLSYEVADRLPSLGLEAVDDLHLDATGQSAKFAVTEASLDVGETQRHVRASEPVSVAMKGSAAAGIEFVLDTRSQAAELRSTAAETVTESGSERIPTRFESHNELWFALIGIAAGVLAAAWRP